MKLGATGVQVARLIKAREKDRRAMAAKSDSLIRSTLCYMAGQVEQPSRSYTEKAINREVLTEFRDEAKRRGWSKKRIRRAEKCRGRGL